jgi:lipid A oxidase
MMQRKMVARLRWTAVPMLVAIGSGAALRAETQLAAYLGNTWTADSGVTIAGRTFQGVSWATRSFRAPPYYGLRAARFFAASGWGISIDFFHDKAYAADGSLAPTLRRLSFSHGLNHLTIDVDRRFRVGPLRPYLGLGAGTLVPHVEAQSDSASIDEYQWFRGVSLKAQAGVQGLVAGPLGLFAEYRFTFAHLGVSTPAGDLSTSLSTHHVIAGVFVAL